MCVLWHIVLWTACYNIFLGGGGGWGYYENTKTFCRGFIEIDNLYVTLYRSAVNEHCYDGEHVGFLSPIQFCSDNLGSIFLGCVALMSTYDSDAILEKIFCIINDFLGHYYEQS